MIHETRNNINFYQCDCMALMKRTPDKFYDLSICDPPYGLGDKLTSGGTWSVKWQDKGADWDKAPNKEYFEQLFRVSKNWVVFGGNYLLSICLIAEILSLGINHIWTECTR